MNKAFEKIIEKLEERTSFLSDCTKYGNKDAKQQNKSYSTMMMYEVADLVDDLIEIVKQEAEQFGTDTNVGSKGWIPCSERLPEEDGFYLATLDGEIVGEEKSFSGLAEFENGKWVDDEEDYQCVLAWQPLPKPFQKGE